jgi:hypothetical protein
MNQLSNAHQLTLKIDTDPGGEFMINVEDIIL